MHFFARPQMTTTFLNQSDNTQLTRIGDIVKLRVRETPDSVALAELSGSWTYAQLASAIAEAEIWIAKRGVRPGDRVMIVCENCRAFVALLFAITNADAWPVLINARLSAGEVEKIREHCGARLAIYTSDASPHAAEHAKSAGAAICQLGEAGSIGVSERNDEVIPEPLDACIADRVAALIYTSGTTGTPKGVMLTHKNLLYMASTSSQIRKLTPNDRLFGILPMSHSVGLSVVLLGGLLSGSAIYLSPRFDPITARRALEKERITILLGVPAMYAQIVEYAKLRGITKLDLPDLRIISSSGAPLHPATKAAVEDLFGLPLHNGYGITECSPTIAQAVPEEQRSDTSVGRILPGLEVQFIGSDGQQVTAGEVGELHVRGPNVMKGYYRAPEETAAVIDRDGWFNTRDLARLEDGALFIVGRTKELIVHLGFNVYPAEVESVLGSHTEVVRAAVVGLPAKGSADEDVVAFVELIPGSSLMTDDLARYAAQRLAQYKTPSQIYIVPTMPLTPTGKIKKAMLLQTAGLTALRD